MDDRKVWWISQRGNLLGPFRADEVKSLLLKGEIVYWDFIYRDGYQTWKCLIEVPELFVDSSLVSASSVQQKRILLKADEVGKSVEEPVVTRLKRPSLESLRLLHEAFWPEPIPLEADREYTA